VKKGTAEAPSAESPSAEASAIVEAEPAPPAPAKPAASVKKPAAGGALPTTTAERIAWCRQHDAK
jgi:hypothetical protein